MPEILAPLGVMQLERLKREGYQPSGQIDESKPPKVPALFSDATECFIVAMARKDGTMPKPEKAICGRLFFDLVEAKVYKEEIQRLHAGVQVYLCQIGVLGASAE